MSYDLEIAVPVGSWEEAERLAEATRGPEHLSLVTGRRRRWLRDRPASIHLDWDEAQEVLDDDMTWGQDAFTLSPRREALARTVLLLGERVPPGWTLRSQWFGDPVDEEARVTAEQLAGLVRRSALRRTVLYRVVAPAEAGQARG